MATPLSYRASPVGTYSHESGFMKVLNAIQTPLYITAGLIDEWRKREDGYGETPYSTILKESSANLFPFLGENRRRTTYGDMVGNKALAFGLDIFGDPLTYVPMAWTTKAAKGVLGASKFAVKTPIKVGAMALDRAAGINSYGALERLSDRVHRAFIANFDVNKLGGKELTDLVEKSYREVDYADAFFREKVHKEMKALIPKLDDRERVLDLVERSVTILPGHKMTADEIARMVADPDYIAWGKEIAQLPEDLTRGYAHAKGIKRALEAKKIESRMLSEERALGFLNKFEGSTHMHHMKGTKEVVIKAGEKFLRRYHAGKPDAVGRMKSMQAHPGGPFLSEKDAVSHINRLVSDMGGMMEANPEALQRIRGSIDMYKKRGPSMTTVGGPSGAQTLGYPTAKVKRSLGESINMDVAEVLGVEAGWVAKGSAAVKHVDALIDYVKSKSMMFDDIPDIKDLEKLLGASKARNLVRGGFDKLEDIGIPELKGKYVPKAISEEVKRALYSYKNPKALTGFFSTFKKVQNIWKAHTLSYFLTYHARNHISNMWNNYLAGMDPVKDAPHYANAINLLVKRRLGTASKSELGVLEEATKMRVLKQGFFRGEMEDSLTETRPLGRAIKHIYHPAHNKAIKGGMILGNAIEDADRLAHYFWAKGKGMKAPDAASSVNKYLFDYKYGLSPFEKAAFRDFAAPFYAWTRFNMPLQLEMLATRPGRFATLPKGIRALEDVGEFLNDEESGAPKPNEIFMADWMKRATKIRMRFNKKTNAYEYFMLDNWIPSADVGKLFNISAFRDMVSGLASPGVKLPIEIVFNYNLFRKRPISEFPGHRGRLFNKAVQPHFEHLLRTIRLVNEADKTFDAFVTRGGETSKWEATSRVIVGKVYPYRPEQQKKWWVFNMNKRIGRLTTIRNYSEKRGWKDQVGVLDGLIEEIKAERDYYKKLKVGR